jgi:hypothetical protein
MYVPASLGTINIFRGTAMQPSEFLSKISPPVSCILVQSINVRDDEEVPLEDLFPLHFGMTDSPIPSSLLPLKTIEDLVYSSFGPSN